MGIALSTLVPHGPTPNRPKDRFLTKTAMVG